MPGIKEQRKVSTGLSFPTHLLYFIERQHLPLFFGFVATVGPKDACEMKRLVGVGYLVGMFGTHSRLLSIELVIQL